jgi:transposase
LTAWAEYDFLEEYEEIPSWKRSSAMIRYKITLTIEERQLLEKMVSTGKGAARKLAHARILLLADEGDQGPGRTNAAIVSALGVSERTVERVRKRFVTESFEAALNPRPQPPRPDKVKIKGAVEQQLIELACSDPPTGRSRWTLELLADRLVVLRCVDGVSTETVRQALKKTTSSLGR